MMNLIAPSAFPSLTQAECITLQKELALRIVQQDILPPEELHTAAGVDLAYWTQGETERAVCCIVVIDIQTKAVIETQDAAGVITFPYLPGCLAFRELPLVLTAAARLKHKPDIFLFDGNGILHPRGLGLAAHASFYLQTPTAGIAKTYYRVEGAAYSMPHPLAGSWSDIVKGGAVLGRAVRTHQDVKPIFVSVGNWITLDTATELALRLTGRESRIPIPTRYADLETHIKRDTLRIHPTEG